MTGLPLLDGCIAARGSVLGDVDGDGDLDLVLASNNIFGGKPGARPFDRLLINDGFGLFADGTFGPETGLPAVAEAGFDVSLGDIDRDGDLDIVIGKGVDFRDRLYLNDGRGQFLDVCADADRGLPDEAGAGYRMLFADLDRDGDQDLLRIQVGGMTTPNFVLYNE